MPSRKEYEEELARQRQRHQVLLQEVLRIEGVISTLEWLIQQYEQQKPVRKDTAKAVRGEDEPAVSAVAH